MLVGDTHRGQKVLKVSGYAMKFSLAGEGTKVSMHSLRTLFVLII